MMFNNHILPSNLIAYAKDYPHGTLEPSHSHHCAQLLHTLSGVIRVTTDQGNWVIPPNKGMWIPPGTTHSLQMTGAVQVRTLFVDPLARADLPNTCLVTDVSSLLQALIIEALAIPIERASGSRDERIIELILDELRRLTGHAFYVPTPCSTELVELCRQIQERIAHPWTATDAAHFLNVSERTAIRKFQAEMGLTFNEWLRQTRLLFALENLALGKGVLETALASGYESPSAFSAMFKSRLGLSPKDCFPLKSS